MKKTITIICIILALFLWTKYYSIPKHEAKEAAAQEELDKILVQTNMGYDYAYHVKSGGNHTFECTMYDNDRHVCTTFTMFIPKGEKSDSERVKVSDISTTYYGEYLGDSKDKIGVLAGQLRRKIKSMSAIEALKVLNPPEEENNNK